MKKSVQNKSSSFIRAAIATVAIAVLWAAVSPFSADAAGLQGSAGNTIIRNTVTVNYADNSGHAQAAVTSVVSLTVNTVAVAPTILSIAPSPGSTDGTGTTQPYTVTVRTNSNGPGSVSLAGADGSATNITLSGTGPTTPAAQTLGSTIFDPTATEINVAQSITNNSPMTVAVPSDGLTGGSTINGLVVGSNVYVTDGTNYYGPWQVTAVTDPAPGAGTTAAPGSVTLKNTSGGTLAFTPQYGWEILAFATYTVTVTQGQVTNQQSAASWVTTMTASMGGLNSVPVAVTTNAHGASLLVQKYVRNVTNAVAGTGIALVNPPINGAATYYPSGVSGKPGDVLEYAVVVTNNGTGNATLVVATDPVPTYSTLYSSSGAYGANNTGGATGTFGEIYYNSALASIKGDGSGGTSGTGYGKTAGTAAGSIMTFYLGAGSTNSAGGSLSLAAPIAYIVYQVTIN
jgi:uncharacterized repeat protein (TIGR01451 family)